MRRRATSDLTDLTSMVSSGNHRVSIGTRESSVDTLRDLDAFLSASQTSATMPNPTVPPTTANASIAVAPASATMKNT